MNCANCSDKAFYEYKVTTKTSIFYCNKHLPRFLTARKTANLIPITDANSEALDSALKTLTTTVDTPADDSTPAPAKKATKKKAE